MQTLEGVPQRLLDTMATLWETRITRPSSVYESSRFRALVAVSVDLYHQCRGEQTAKATDLDSALRHFFQRHGAPWFPDSGDLDTVTAAATLWDALRAESHRVTYVIPLDLLDGDDLPNVDYGPAKIRNLSPSKLGEIIQVRALKRRFPGEELDIDEFDGRKWLIVEETETVPSLAGQGCPSLDDLLDGLWRSNELGLSSKKCT